MARRNTAHVPKQSTKTYREIREIATKYGYKYGGLNSRGHLKWIKAGRLPVITVSKMSDTRVLLNTEATFRRIDALKLSNQHSNQSGNDVAAV